MTKVIIEKVFRGEQETKFGTRNKLGIKVKGDSLKTDTGSIVDPTDKWLSFMYKGSEDMGSGGWEAGMEVDVTITQKGEYLNFTPKVASASDLEARVSKLEDAVFGGAKTTKPVKKAKVDEPEDEIDWE